MRAIPSTGIHGASEAFERARLEDKPIFLSIGYSTCHWCHVMEHESFESAAIATLLNDDFVSIKVDREERPDVDRVYMSFVQSTTGSGGWPMTVFLTPELKPFFGGTYFPPASRWGRPGFADLLGELARVWKNDRAKVEQAAAELFERLKLVTGAAGPGTGPNAVAGADALDAAVEQSRRAFDARHGGFGDAPKFPRPSELLFLLREHARRGPHGDLSRPRFGWRSRRCARWRSAGCATTSAEGSIAIPSTRSGACRISRRCCTTRRSWCWRTSRPRRPPGTISTRRSPKTRWSTSCGICRDPEGGFYSAEDADSIPPEHAGDPAAHKTEGAFYIWTDREIADLLGNDAEIARRRFGIEPDGNAPHDPQGEFTGKNLLYIAEPIEDIAARTGASPEGVIEALGRIRAALFAARARRPRPHLDDKILTAWNGLMIAAFARAARHARVCTLSRRRAAGRDVHPRRRCGTSRKAGCSGAIAMAKPRLTRTPKTTRS